MPLTPWQFNPNAGPNRPNRTPWTIEPFPQELEAPAGGTGNPPPPPSPSPPNGDAPGGVVINRRFIRAFWGGITGSSVRQLASLPSSPALVIGRRAPLSRAVIGNSNQVGDGIAAPAPVSPVVVTAAPLQPPPLSRRFPPRAIFRGIAALPQQPQLLARPPPTAVAVRPPTKRSNAVWLGTVVRTVNASSAAAPSGSVQPLATVSQPHRPHPRALVQGRAVPGRRSTPVTGGLIRRRSSARAVWARIIGPPRQIPVTGGLVKRRASARAVWSGRAVPGVLGVPVTGTGLVKRRSSARMVWAGIVVRTVNATQFGPAGSQPGSGLVKRRGSARAFWCGLAVPSAFSQPVTGGILVSRRPFSAFWYGVKGPIVIPGIPGSIQPAPTFRPSRRTTARGFWGGLAGTVVIITPCSYGQGNYGAGIYNCTAASAILAVTGGISKRRTAARAYIQFTPVRTVNATPPPTGSIQPRPTVQIPRRYPSRALWQGNAEPGIRSAPVTGSGLVKRRRTARGVWGGLIGPPRQIPVTGGLVKRRTAARGIWAGRAVPGVLGVPVTGQGLVKRRTSQHAFWLGVAVRTFNATPQFGPPGNQPGSGLVKRRTSQRAFIQFTPVRTVNAQPLGVGISGGLIKRRTSAPAFIKFKPVRTVNQLQPVPTPIQPRAAVPVPRRTAARAVVHSNITPFRYGTPVTGGLIKRRVTAPAVWRGHASPFRYGAPVTGGLIKRRTSYRDVHLGVIVRTTNALPVPGSQPGGVIQHRNAARTGIRAFIWFKPVILNVLGIPFENIIITLGAPRTHWDTGNAGVRWEQASATLRWRASDPVANHWQKGSPQIRWRDGP